MGPLLHIYLQYVQYKINFHLTNGKGLLKDANRNDILFGQFYELDVSVSVRPDSFSVPWALLRLALPVYG